jgi:hypothetical protein
MTLASTVQKQPDLQRKTETVATSNLVLKKEVNSVLPIKYIVNLFSDICAESQEFPINSM